MKVSMFQWVGGTPCPEWFKDREVVEMTEDEFYSKLKELTSSNALFRLELERNLQQKSGVSMS